MGDGEVIQPLVGGAGGMVSAAEMMLEASQNMLSAAEALAGEGTGGARGREGLAEAVEAGFLRALRRESLLGEENGQEAGSALWSGGGIRGTGYGRMGARITGSGQRAQTYGAVGGAIGYAVGGPVGALVGGMLGGLLGGDDDDEEAQRAEELRRQWLNSPEGFEIEAYLYNLARGYAATGPRRPWGQGGGPWWNAARATPVVVRMEPGAVQIHGQGAEAGEEAARAFAGRLGRALELNSVVAPAAGVW